MTPEPRDIRTPLLILAAAGMILYLAGCKAPAVGNQLGVGADVGHAQDKADVIADGVTRLRPFVIPTGIPLLDSIGWAANALSTTELPMIAAKFQTQAKAVDTLNARNGFLEDHYKNDWMSQWQKRKLYWIVGVWLGLGIGATIAGIIGGPVGIWISSSVIRLLPLSNVFAIARDRITNTTRVTTPDPRKGFVRLRPKSPQTK